jgi:hypothetical protein
MYIKPRRPDLNWDSPRPYNINVRQLQLQTEVRYTSFYSVLANSAVG